MLRHVMRKRLIYVLLCRERDIFEPCYDALKRWQDWYMLHYVIRERLIYALLCKERERF